MFDEWVRRCTRCADSWLMLPRLVSLQGTSGSAPEAADLVAALQEHQVTWACVYAFPAGCVAVAIHQVPCTPSTERREQRERFEMNEFRLPGVCEAACKGDAH